MYSISEYEGVCVTQVPLLSSQHFNKVHSHISCHLDEEAYERSDGI